MIHKLLYPTGPIWIEDAQIKTRISPTNLAHYGKFYQGITIGQEITVNVLFLPEKSNIKVTAVCPLCEQRRSTAKCNLAQSGHSYCQKCRQRISAYGKYIGQKIGKLTITGFGPPVDTQGGGKLTTLCGTCECGSTTTVYAQTVARSETQGRTMSCGCYVVEKAKEIGLANDGPNNGMYRPDISDQDREKLIKRRKIQKAKNWSKSVRSRDLACVVCNSQKPLVAHHLYSFRINKELRYDPSNGITLCTKCHDDFHYGYMPNTTEYCTASNFYEFLRTVYQWPQSKIDDMITAKGLLA